MRRPILKNLRVLTDQFISLGGLVLRGYDKGDPKAAPVNSRCANNKSDAEVALDFNVVYEVVKTLYVFCTSFQSPVQQSLHP